MPLALISSSASIAPTRPCWPEYDMAPDTGCRTPTFTGAFCAVSTVGAASAAAPSAEEARKRRRFNDRRDICCSPLEVWTSLASIFAVMPDTTAVIPEAAAGGYPGPIYQRSRSWICGSRLSLRSAGMTSVLRLDLAQLRIVRRDIEPRHDAGQLRTRRRIEFHHQRIVSRHDVLRRRRIRAQRVVGLQHQPDVERGGERPAGHHVLVEMRGV